MFDLNQLYAWSVFIYDLCIYSSMCCLVINVVNLSFHLKSIKTSRIVYQIVKLGQSFHVANLQYSNSLGSCY